MSNLDLVKTKESRVKKLWMEFVESHSDDLGNLDLEFVDRLGEPDNGFKDEFVRLPYAAPASDNRCHW